MGYYIQTDGVRKKSQYLIDKHNAERISQPVKFEDIPDDKGLVCVVDNIVFEAAAYCFNESEFLSFNSPSDMREKIWLVMDKKEVEKLSGYVA